MNVLEVIKQLGPLETFLIVFISALLTWISTALLDRSRHGGQIASKIVDQYLLVREHLTEQLVDLSIKPYNSPIDEKELAVKAIDISRIYYKYFDYLPRTVLDSLLCLITCLQDKKHRLFGHRDGRIYPLDKQERAHLISKIGLYANWRISTSLVFATESAEAQKIAQVAAIVCQTRKVLFSIHETFNMYHLMSLIKELQKHGRRSKLTF